MPYAEAVERVVVGAGVVIVAGAIAVGSLLDDSPEPARAAASPTPTPIGEIVSQPDDGVVPESSPPETPPSPPLSVETAEPRPGVDYEPFRRPPTTTLASRTGEVEGERGSYCWDNVQPGRGAVVAVCSDVSHTPIPDVGIEAEWGETLVLSFEHPVGPSSVSNTWFRDQEAGYSPGAEEDTGKAGPWILDIFTRWDTRRWGSGDASYTFLVDVRPR